MIPKELQYVKVLAVTTSEGADRVYNQKQTNEKDKEQELPSTITLLVNRTQAKLLADLEQKSKIHVSLIYRGSEENSQKFLDEQKKLINDNKDSNTGNMSNTDNSVSQGASTNEQ